MNLKLAQHGVRHIDMGYTGKKNRDYQREWSRKANERVGGYRNSPPAGTPRFFTNACSKIKSKSKTNNIDFYFDVSAKKDKNYFFEVEIKNQWGSSWNPAWKEVRIPERKNRLIKRKEKDYPDCDLYFVVFNTNCSQAWFIKDSLVNESSVGTIQNSRQPKDSPHLKEPFFHIPVEKAKLIQISS